VNARAQGRWGYFFCFPFIAIFALFFAYPLFQSLSLTLRETYGPKASRFVGLGNFVFLLNDPTFWKAMTNTAVFAAGSVFIQLPLSLALAMLLNRPGLRGRAFFRLVFFAPSLVGLVFVAAVFSLIFEKRTGLLNVVLHRLIGLDLDYPWLQEHVMAAMIIASLWVYVGFNMIYFLAALQSVDPALIDAAVMDGAGPAGRFLHVTLPAIKPVGSLVVLLSLIGSFQLFELPFILLGGSGPDQQGLTIAMYMYQCGFETGDLGYACTIGWVLAILLFGFAAVQQWIYRSDD
jgi:ABC-type sugar transport system permease subunit